MQKIAIVILAAGRGARMGCVKQLVSFEGESLLARSIRTAQMSSVGPIYIVLGFEAEQLAAQVPPSAKIILNKTWKEGIASSIRCAITELEQHDFDGVIFTTIDQPFITSELLRSLADAFSKTQKEVVASLYGKPGIPALFARTKFAELLELQGDRGAKQIIFSSDAHLIEAPRAEHDIDTLADLEALKKEATKYLISH